MLLTYLFYAYLIVISLFAVITTVTGFMRYKDPAHAEGYNPRTLVIVPCKGMDFKMEENLLSIKKQIYKNYSMIAVVDSASDSAIRIIRKCGIKHIVARRLGNGSGKVNAIANALLKYRNYQVYAIADSDTMMKSTWLGDLVNPLSSKRIGLSTSYPYFEASAGFASKLKCVWGLVGEGMMESEFLRFAWGGSTAFKKELLSNKGLDEFKGSISDDAALAHISKRKGLRITYVRRAQPTVRSTDTISEFIEWSNRQTALSIAEDSKKLSIGLPFYLLSILLIISAFALTIFYSYFAILLFVPIIQKEFKTFSRLRNPSLTLLLIDLIMPAFYAINLAVASGMRSISWRGRRYELS